MEGLKLGPEAQGVIGISSDPKANLKAFPGAYSAQKQTYQDKIKSTMEARDTELNPLQESLSSQESVRDKFETEKTPISPAAVPAPKFQTQEIGEGFSLMLGLASLAGLASRQPLTAALNNMTGMMKGLHEGNQENFQRSYLEWQDNFKQAEAKYKDELNAYQKTLGDMNKSIDQKMREVRDTALRYDNKLVMASLNSENPNDLLKVTGAIEKQSSEIERLAQGWAKISAAQEKSAKVEADKEAGIPDAETLAFMAKQYLAGDKSVTSGLARNKAALNALREEITKQAKSANISPQRLATITAEFEGLKAGERALATRSASIEMAVVEAQKLATLAVDASDSYPRGDWVPLNKIGQLMDENIRSGNGEANDKISEFTAATNSFINVYARALNPTGVPTVSDKDHAREMLYTAKTQGAFRAAIKQLQKEMEAARESPGEVKRAMREGAEGKEPAAATTSDDDLIGKYLTGGK